MKKNKSPLALLTAVILLLSVMAPIPVQAAYVGESYISSLGAFVMDFETGAQLYAHEADTPRTPASMTKLMSAYIIYDAISNGVISLDTIVPISEGVSEFSRDWEYSNVELSIYGTYTVSELLDVVIVGSACAATCALAELLYGSEEAFVERMNEKASELGLNAVFFDSYGGSDENEITPREMAVLVRKLLLDHPDILEKTSLQTVTFDGEVYGSTNILLFDYPEVDGLKTGTTSAAGACFAGTAVRDGRRIIAVTMGSESDYMRFADTMAMLNYGFSRSEPESEWKPPLMAAPATTGVMVNEELLYFTIYNIDDRHYFKLRDIAALVNGSPKQFDVIWDEENNAVQLLRFAPYTAVGGELAVSSDGYREVKATSSTIYLDGEQCELNAYLIGGNNYFMLRDIAKMFDFAVTWHQESLTVAIEAEMPYSDG